jgi:hypothetical protein
MHSKATQSNAKQSKARLIAIFWWLRAPKPFFRFCDFGQGTELEGPEEPGPAGSTRNRGRTSPGTRHRYSLEPSKNP